LSARVRLGQEAPDLAPACLRLLKSPLPYLRWEAAERLGEVKEADEEVIHALTKAAEDSNGLVREKARRSLKKLKSASGV
jgi:HEAT repeat protein